MRAAILWNKTEFSLVHVDVRRALDESYDGVGPRPPYDERVYAAAIAAGASDEWRIMSRRVDRPDQAPQVHRVYTREPEALAAMEQIKANAEADAAWVASIQDPQD